MPEQLLDSHSNLRKQDGFGNGRCKSNGFYITDISEIYNRNQAMLKYLLTLPSSIR